MATANKGGKKKLPTPSNSNTKKTKFAEKLKPIPKRKKLSASQRKRFRNGKSNAKKQLFTKELTYSIYSAA